MPDLEAVIAASMLISIKGGEVPEVREKRQRTCVGCGLKSDKVELMRIVRIDGAAKFDVTGRAAGRGAYVCSKECLEKALANRKLQRALKCAIEKEDADIMVEQVAATMVSRLG